MKSMKSINDDSRGSIEIDKLNTYSGKDPQEMDEDERKVLCWVKIIHFFNFVLFSAIYGSFAFSFWRILEIERPECIAPKEDYL